MEKVLLANTIGNETWKPLSSPFVRINFDAAFNRNDIILVQDLW
ncbi:hypothetical protein Gogos_000667 [Gossypium gossypioides]|uniref:Uncharacterized protein n=1 Tax=Gossypium gossypioides TaxID=34282 RepID=A0A7J9CTF6_GOSGO|nr:hypothetical protein [Gossypium gossypioides]